MSRLLPLPSMSSRLVAIKALIEHAVRQARPFIGSRADPETATAARVDACLVLLVLGGRLIHLSQAVIDVSVGRRAYTYPSAALVVAAACLIESVLLSTALARLRRLSLPLLVADAVFGSLGLTVLAFATSNTAGRTGTIDWMLPYTVTTAVGLGLVVARSPLRDAPMLDSRRSYDWRGLPVVVGLAVVYATSLSLSGLAPGETLNQVLLNAFNYPVFYLGAAGISVGLRRQLDVIAAKSCMAKREAAKLAEQALWRLVAIDVFGPVLDLLERASEMGEVVPLQLREEANRLISLIDAINPLVEPDQRP